MTAVKQAACSKAAEMTTNFLPNFDFKSVGVCFYAYVFSQLSCGWQQWKGSDSRMMGQMTGQFMPVNWPFACFVHGANTSHIPITRSGLQKWRSLWDTDMRLVAYWQFNVGLNQGGK